MRPFIVIMMIIIAGAQLFAEQLSEKEKQSIKAIKNIEHVLVESYHDDSFGVAMVLGYHFDYFLTQNIYAGTAIFGAIGGHRGGYGIASVGLGVRQPFFGVQWDSKVLLGSGGGGGFKAGGGFSIQAQTGPSIQLSKGLFWDIKWGYLSFPTGEVRTLTFSTGLSFETFRLQL